jgi:hypothetical protein
MKSLADLVIWGNLWEGGEVRRYVRGMGVTARVDWEEGAFEGKQGGGVDEDMLLREAGVVGVSKLQIQSYLHGIEVVNLSHQKINKIENLGDLHNLRYPR